MLSTTHTIISAAVGTNFHYAPAAFTVAFLVHLFSDTLLHWNIYPERHRHARVWTVVDVLGGLLLLYLLAPEQALRPTVVAAVLGGNAPDIWHGLWDLFRQHSGKPTEKDGLFYRLHDGLQQETTATSKGLLWQILLIGVSFWILAR